ncbi:MAG: outer membrane protein assembly factor BamA [Candidatus Babeliaceae bacterium]
MSYTTRHLFILWLSIMNSGNLYSNEINNSALAEYDLIPKRINAITISGNIVVSTSAIESKIPYKKNDIFKASKSNALIKTLFNLGYFRNIKVMTEPVSDSLINIIIIVEEKNKVENIIYTGNKHLTADEIEKKIHISEIKSIDPEELPNLEEQLKKLYIEKSYHNATITSSLVQTAENRVNLEFCIEEGEKSLIKRVFFTGNKTIPSRKLRTLIFTREDWILGFFDKAGSYQPDAIEYDKHVIENFYQSNGFLTAHVTDALVETDPCNKHFTVTFVIEEGDIYAINSVTANGTDVMPSEHVVARIPIKPGHVYSKEMVRTTMEALRLMWGEFGYIYADVQPNIKPNVATKTVDLEFITDLGNKINVNRINIIGNKKTRDKVIRREFIVNEGEMLTSFAMEESKRRVELLGYFDQKNGVNWKISRINEKEADLDLILKEVKTGKLFGQIGFGGLDDIKSPSQSFKFGGGIQDTNLLGTGISYNANGTYSFQDSTLSASIATPWLFNRPIRAGIDVNHRDTIYDDFKNVNTTPAERTTGFVGNLGLKVPRLYYSVVLWDGGWDKIRYKSPILAVVGPQEQAFQPGVQKIIDNAFIPGNLAWIGLSSVQDLRNHPTFPTSGHQWIVNTKVGIPHNAPGNFGFFKFDADIKYFTPLIDVYNLVLYMHGHVGLIAQLGKHEVPYRELYHIGGIATVRGFEFGQIGPQLAVPNNDMLQTSSLGGKKAFWLNLELQFPITPDMGLRGVFFYDGGAGWDVPNGNTLDPLLLRNNHFSYRHSIGLGVRLLYPTPVRIDWGFKLDRKKKRGESASEIHFTAIQEF